MSTSEAKEIKKQETLLRFSIISYKTRLRVLWARTAAHSDSCAQSDSSQLFGDVATLLLTYSSSSPWFFINQPLFVQKLSFYDISKENLFKIGVWIWARRINENEDFMTFQAFLFGKKCNRFAQLLSLT